MTVVKKPYIILDIVEIKNNPINPMLSVFHVKAILETWFAKTNWGRQKLMDLGFGQFMDQLNQQYNETSEAFVATVPVTGQTIEWNKYQVGGKIMIAYYPENVKINAEVIE